MILKNIFCWIIGLIISANLSSQTTASYNWQNVAIGGGGFVSGIVFSPIEQNVIYSRTDVGGAYRWNEGDQSWISMMDWVDAGERGLLGIESLTVDPKQPGKVYMMAGTIYWNMGDDGIGKSAFLRSNDYGQTWETIPVWDNSTKNFNVNGNGMGRGNGERLAVDPSNSNNMFYGSRNKGLWKSTNNGSSWSKVNAFPVDTTWNGCGISFVAFDPSNTSRIYAGVYRKADNLFVSENGGITWSLVPNMPQPTYDGSTSMGLMPQRIAIKPDGSAFYLTLGNGAGPHTMAWDEGWGPIQDWYNRGAVYKYDLATTSWSDISPQNFIDPDESDNPYTDPSTYFGTYSGISVDPNNPEHIVASSCASYRGPQFWLIDGEWHDEWGDNIFVSEDGGKTWVPSFQYYWLDGGYYPPTEQMDENGYPWIIHSKIHWISSVAIDPFNSKRVFVNSGNGVWSTDDIFNYEWSYTNEWGNADTSYTQHTVWKFSSKGIEEVVPEDVVSIPGGPLVSVMGDIGGFVHDDVKVSPSGGMHKVLVSGEWYNLGSTAGLAYAPKSGKLAQCAKVREVSTRYNTIPIGPVQYSTDSGATWTVETYTTNPPTDLNGGKVALSADGSVTLWMPSTGTTMYRQSGSTWTIVNGISFSGRPVGDQVNPDIFYVYNKTTGYIHISNDAGVSFIQAGYAGTSNFRNAVAVPDQEGHVWVPLATENGGGLMRSTDGGNTFTQVSGVGYCEAVGFGKAATGANYPAVFIFAEVSGVKGIWRSIDQGTSWVRVNDDEHEYGGLANGEFVVGDMNIFGRVYMSTAGRGIVYGDPTGSTIPVTGISITPLVVSVSIGGSSQLNAIISPSNASNQSVTWNSGNSDIATVSSSGLVTGVSAGTVSIIATSIDGGYNAVAEVNVASVSVEGITLVPTSITINPSETQQLTAVISPNDATNKSVVWTTSDESIATVDEDGLVTAIAYGTATVTATTVDGGYTASSSVDVNFVETPVTGISVTPTSAVIEPDETITLDAILEPVYASNQIVYWSSDNESVATVSGSGVVTAISEGVAMITVTSDDGGYSASASISVTEITTPCENPVSITIPFVQNGVGQYCFVTTQEISYINSWNLNELTINGVDFTNTWSNTLPPAVNGEWVIYYDGPYDWSHFEAPQAVELKNTPIEPLSDELKVYPNPFENKIILNFENSDQVNSILIVDQAGKTIETIENSEIDASIEIGEQLKSGMYFLKINYSNSVEIISIIKK